MQNETAVEVREQLQTSMTLKQVTDRVNMVHRVLEKVMKGPSKENPNGVHYGMVPGCGKKMVLLKPGADLLAMTFRLVPQFKVERTDMGDGHREYDVICSMFGPGGELLGQGVGSASTMERKYRYRWEGGEWNAEAKKKVGAKRIENEDIADVYNTVLKIAKKRSHIDATLTVTGAADLFTQDLIDDDGKQPASVTMPKSKSEGKPSAPPATSDGEPPPAGAPDGEKTISGIIKVVTRKPGTSDRGDYVKCGICVTTETGDRWLNTFNTDLADEAEKAKGRKADFVVKEGRFGMDLIDFGLPE